MADYDVDIQREKILGKVMDFVEPDAWIARMACRGLSGMHAPTVPAANERLEWQLQQRDSEPTPVEDERTGARAADVERGAINQAIFQAQCESAHRITHARERLVDHPTFVAPPGSPVQFRSMSEIQERYDLIKNLLGMHDGSSAAELIAYTLYPDTVKWVSGAVWADYLVDRSPAEFDTLVSIVRGLLETCTPRAAARTLTNHVRARHGLHTLQ